MSVNKVILIGRAGKDPDVRTLDGGAKVASLSFATTDKAYTLQNGTQVPERTEWHNLIFWNKTAEIVEKYVHKGDKLYIEGKLRTRNYDDSKGVKRYITEVFVDSIEMLTPKVQTTGCSCTTTVTNATAYTETATTSTAACISATAISTGITA